MSVCGHDQTCPGSGPRHALQMPAGVLPEVTHAPMSDAGVRRLRRAILKASRDYRALQVKAVAR